jgi:hypothetical protein
VAARSADGALIANGSDDGTLTIREVFGNRTVARWKAHDSDVAHVAFTDRQHIASLGPAGDLRFWDLDTKKEYRPNVELDKIDGFVAFTPAGPKIAACTAERHQEFVRDLASGRKYKLPHDAVPMVLAFSADGRRLATSGTNLEVEIWNVEAAPKLLVTLPLGQSKRGRALALTFSPDGRRLAVGHAGSDISLWDAADGTELWSQIAHVEKVRSIAFSPDGLWLASGGEDGGASVREVETGQQVFHCEAHAGAVTQVLFGRDPRTLLTVSRDGTALLWNLRPKEPGPAELTQLWKALASEDAKLAFRAWWAMAERPDALPMLRDKLREVGGAFENDRIARRLSELDHPRFAVREAASRELAVGRQALEPVLRRELALAESLEKRARLSRLLDGLSRLRDPEQLRLLRAIAALGCSPAPEAKELLQDLSRGSALSPLTQAAQAELARSARK